MPAYDGVNFHPPAPTAVVLVRNIATGAILADVTMQIDTGADMTLLPRSVIAQLAIPSLPAGQFEIMAFDGTRSATDAVETDMIFLNVAYRGKYLLTDEDVGILGRDVLASIVLLLDGPNQ